jgi:hypothetical protein
LVAVLAVQVKVALVPVSVLPGVGLVNAAEAKQVPTESSSTAESMNAQDFVQLFIRELRFISVKNKDLWIMCLQRQPRHEKAEL